jgi:hypothetical protein
VVKTHSTEKITTRSHSNETPTSPNRITATTYEVSEANIIKEEPEEEVLLKILLFII